ncbi:MAG TPA: sigma-70 family RNA polymerase sigma factor [Micropepsaceae bacterium]|nr:sigma-70 family RNA polymerase sigma factor [Micropepsaceae bacterium]
MELGKSNPATRRSVPPDLAAGSIYQIHANEIRASAGLACHAEAREMMLVIAADFEEMAAKLDGIFRIFSFFDSPASSHATYRPSMGQAKLHSLAKGLRFRRTTGLPGSSTPFDRYYPIRTPSGSVLQLAQTAGADHARVIAGIAHSRDRDCFRLLFLHYTPRIKAYLRGFGIPPVVAEELAQETMLAVWAKASTFDPNLSSPSTWIFTIARNICIDRRRHANRRKPADSYFDDSLPVVTPAEDWCAVERTEKLTEALNGLSTDQITAIRLSFFEQKSHSEIAAALQIPLGTVKYRLRQALNRLRAALHDLE